jgi:hypothetical protein
VEVCSSGTKRQSARGGLFEVFQPCDNGAHEVNLVIVEPAQSWKRCQGSQDALMTSEEPRPIDLGSRTEVGLAVHERLLDCGVRPERRSGEPRWMTVAEAEHLVHALDVSLEIPSRRLRGVHQAPAVELQHFDLAAAQNVTGMSNWTMW